MTSTLSGPGPEQGSPGPAPQAWSPWRAVVAFGLVSLAADMVYEGMRSVSGPFLDSLGASAFIVGLVTGAGEAVALVLRLGTGAWADHSQRHWRLTVLGYGMTAVCVPLLAVAPFLGAAGVAVAATLILLERTGKAFRSPSKSALLARMAVQTGRGRGFAVHKALDQVGAVAGPLLLAGAAATTGRYWPGFALMVIPGAICLLLLAQLRRRVPGIAEPEVDAEAPVTRPATSGWQGMRTAVLGSDLPRVFHLFSLSAALTTAGLMTFGVISYELVNRGIFSLAAVPLVYALAMAVEAVAALVTGDLFDRWGARVLLAVPFLVAIVPFIVYSHHVWMVFVGILLWGAATGVQDSTVKANVARLVRPGRRATAYGVFAAVQGLGALAGGALAGALITHYSTLLAFCIAALQVVALALLVVTLRASRTTPVSA